jgi:hypothetical protein
MLYGEGENAFLRLQEEIMKKTPDDSIFAWTAKIGSLSIYRGLLARGPVEFQYSGQVRRGNGTFGSSNMGLSLKMEQIQKSAHEWDHDVYLGWLNSRSGPENKKIALLFRHLGGQNYARISCDQFDDWTIPKTEDSNPTTLFVEHTPQIPPKFKSRMMHAFQFRYAPSQHEIPTYRVQSLCPSQLGTTNPPSIIIPHNQAEKRTEFHCFDDSFLACVRLTHDEFSRQDYWTQDHRLCPPIHLLLGYNMKSGNFWTRNLPNDAWPDMYASTLDWWVILSDHYYVHEGLPSTSSSRGSLREVIHVNITPGLFLDHICLMVDIDGLFID